MNRLRMRPFSMEVAGKSENTYFVAVARAGRDLEWAVLEFENGSGEWKPVPFHVEQNAAPSADSGLRPLDTSKKSV
jgi:hypothetical protein